MRILPSKQRTLPLVVLCTISLSAFAGYKCTDSNGQNSYQEQPCKTGSKQRSLALEASDDHDQSKHTSSAHGAIDLVSLNKPEIIQQGPTPTSGFVSFTLRQEWKNLNKSKIRIYYRVRFLDFKGTELYVDSRFRDIEASSSSSAPQVLATFEGKPSDSFKYKDAASATITFSVKGEKEEKVSEKIRITRLQD